MASSVSEPITFLVPGWEERPGDAQGTTRGGAAVGRSVLDGLGGQVKQSVRVGASRAAGRDVRVAAVPDEDVVELEIANGPTLVLHPEHARELLLAQASNAGGVDGNGASTRGGGRAAAVAVPAQLRWSGPAADAATRGFLGDVLLKAVRVVGGVGRDALEDGVADFAASRVVKTFDGRVEEGVYRLSADALTPLKGSGRLVADVPPAGGDAAGADAAILVLVHGTFSSTDGTFSKLWTEHPDLVQRLFETYPDRVYALDHRTLGASPIANALTLARALPARAVVRLLTHSRGGLVAEVLARVCSDPDVDLAAFGGDEYARQREELAELAEVVEQKGIRVDGVVRVACPARGTLLASKRLDAYLSTVRWSLSLAGIPVAPELVGLLAEVARRRVDPDKIPGLAAQIPDSPLVRWLHAAERPLAGDRHVVAGDAEGDSVTSWLKTLMADAFFWTDNDLVVQTRSMYGGSPREEAARFVFDQGGKVSHFAYFANERTARALTDALVAPAPRDFRTIGPLSAAGESSSGDRAARASDRAAALTGNRPALFVLPGILGSNLRVGGDRVWLGWRVVNGLGRLNLGAPGVEPDGPVESAYEQLVRHFADTHDVIAFGYDWRVPIEGEAGRLAAAVSEALAARRKSGQPVRIVAHSMGGVLARTMWLEHPEVWERLMAHVGARLLMLGTPNGGSWAPMQVLSGDDTFANMLTLVGAPFREREARDLMAGFPGFLQLQSSLLDGQSGLDTRAGWERLAREDVERVARRSLWHRLRIQLDAYAWGIPSDDVLRHAVALRRRLDRQRDEDLVRYAGKLVLVVGQAPFTPDGVALDEDGVVYLDAQEAGDGRVTLRSAMLPGVRTWRVDCDHGTLPRHREAYRAYDELLATGVTTAIVEVTGGATRGVAAAVTHVRSRPSRGRVSTLPPEGGADVLRGDRRHTVEEPAARGTALHVSVLNGDLTFVRQPILVGHYRSMRLTGTERVLDRHLSGDERGRDERGRDGRGHSGQMERALRMGLYPSEPGTNKVFINQRADPEAPWRMPRPAAVIVAGLGAEGELRASALASTVSQAVVAWAERAAERPETRDTMQLAVTLIGSGGAGISAGQSAQAVAQGVWDANARLAVSGWPRVERLQFVELYHDRALEAWRALELQAAAAPERFVLEAHVRTGTGPLPRPPVADYRGADYDFMSVQSAERGAHETELSFRLDTKRARTEVLGQHLQSKLVRELVARASNDRSTDAQIRRTLFQLLVPLEVEPFLAGTTEMVIEVDDRTAGVPWEILDTVAGGSATALPWAIRAKLLRKFRTTKFREHPVDADTEASILVIGEPACDASKYPRLPGARREANAVKACLSGVVQQPGGSVRSLISPDDERQQGADARAVIDALMERAWRVVHISGHGEPATAENPQGVVLSNETFLGPHEIGSMRVVPELVFVNCCHLAARDPSELFAGGPPPDRAAFAASVAQVLIDIGVRCVVAAGWAVDDEAAGAFATTFYTAITGGSRFIDAVDAARRAAFDFGGNTWAAYQCYGDPDWRFSTGRVDAQSVAEPIRDELTAIASPTALALALERVTVQSTYWRGVRPDEQRRKVLTLEARYEARWGSVGSIAEGFGRAWKALGDSERAIGWYQRAVAANDGTASLSAAEQLGSLRTRTAWQAVEQAADVWRRDRTPAARAGLRARVRDARATIRAAIAQLSHLAAIQPTMERESLVGAAYKRLALVEAAAGPRRADAEREALRGMREHYAAAEQAGKAQGRRDVYYPAMNRMAAELMAEGAREDWPGFAEDDLEAVHASLDARVGDDPDFWSVAGQTELLVYEGLARRDLAGVLPKILQDYEDLHARVPAPWMWASLRDQATFVLTRYAVRAGPEETEAARQLSKQLKGFARAADT